MITDGSGPGGGNGTGCEGSIVVVVGGGGGGNGSTTTTTTTTAAAAAGTVGAGGVQVAATEAVAATAAALFNSTTTAAAAAAAAATASGGPFTNLTSEVTPTLPPYIRTASMLLCILILGIGVIGNVMVPLVILKTKDMRNSTNIFLVNLSVADLMVLLICTPTVLVEVNSKPETWVLGEHMCKAVPFVELTVAHASVLTILAISFERYYAICEPLRAGYVCTKTRAMLICVMAWAFAALFTSPVIVVADFREEHYFDGSLVNVCLMPTEEMWSRSYFVLSIAVFFAFPLAILIVLYTVIAYHLMSNPGLVAPNMTSSALRYRRQVVLMLGTVVLSFFVCLLPFRAFTLCILFASPEFLLSLGFETYQKILYFCRIMLYLNSAINPILYNLMSTKFRDGFRRLLGIKEIPLLRKGTVTTTTTLTTTTSSSSRKSSLDHHLLRRSAVVRVVSIGCGDAKKVDSNGAKSPSKKKPSTDSVQNGCNNQESYV